MNKLTQDAQNLNRNAVLAHLAQHPADVIEYVTQDATLSHVVTQVVWVEDGELVQPHPTDKGTCLAPERAEYRLAAEVAGRH